MNWPLLQNSVFVAGSATLLATLFGVMGALFLTGLSHRWRRVVLMAAVLGLALPPFVVVDCWISLLGHTGTLRPVLPFNIYSSSGATWVLAIMLWPVPCLALWSAWTRLDPAQLEADLAVRGRYLFWGLLIPLARGAFAGSVALTFVLALNHFAVPAILQVKVLPAEVWIRFSTLFDSAGALALSWPLILAPLLFLLFIRRRPMPLPRHAMGLQPGLFREQLSPGLYRGAGLGTIALVVLTLGFPLTQLISSSRTWTELPGAIAAGQTAIWTSVWTSAAAAALVVGLGLVTGYRFQTARALGAFLWLPLLVPGVLLGIALIAVFNRPFLTSFYQSVGIVVLAFALRYVGFGWQAGTWARRSVDPDLTGAALLDGANSWQRFRHVHWPQYGRQALAAWYLVYVLCLWDVESILLIVPPGGETLSLRIFNLLHYGHNAQVNALCLVLLGIAAAPLLLGLVVRRSARPVLTALACLALAGCGSAPGSDEATLDSQLFSRVMVIGRRGVGLSEFNKPRSVTVDSAADVYAVDMTGRIQKFSPAGVFLLSWQMPETDLGKAKGMCRAPDGGILVLEPHYQRVNHFSPEGKVLRQWGRRGRGPGEFTLPRAVAVNSRGEVYISEYVSAERVQRFSADGTQLLTSIGRAGQGPGEFNRPEGLCVDTQDRVYVADSCNHRIQVFSREGDFLHSYGRAGSGPGDLSYPYDIAVDSEGRQYVCEFGNSRVQVFDAEYRSVEILGEPGAAPGKMSNPWGVALDQAGNLYVADALNHRLQKFIRRSSSGAKGT